jgi:uncharacterized protein (TIGR03118 family)
MGENGDTAQSSDALKGTTSAVLHPKIGQQFTRVNLTSNIAGANNLDRALQNAWGLAFDPSGVAYVSQNGNGSAALYDSTGKATSAGITIPAPGGGMSAPTGQVYNADTAAFGGDRFIAATEDGTIAGWQPSLESNYALRIDSSGRGAVYKGLTLASSGGAMRIYATDFHNGAIDVFDASYHPVRTKGSFSDGTIPAGFAPFNIKAVHGALVVTYAKQNAEAHDDVKGVGNGFVNLFDTEGNLVGRLGTQGTLNSPWAIEETPWDFGNLSNRLLIGNFGDGKVNVFNWVGGNRQRAVPDGQLLDNHNTVLSIDGLWALSFGVGAGGFDTHVLYFTAGPNDEHNGVFGLLHMTDFSQFPP